MTLTVTYTKQKINILDKKFKYRVLMYTGELMLTIY